MASAEFLDCPSCGQSCKTIPPYRPSPDLPFPHWAEGDYGKCQCGVELFVEVDDERARLVEANETP